MGSTEAWAVLTPILTAVVTGLLLKLGDWYLNRGKDQREIRKDLREEVKELWEHSDTQDAKIADLNKQIIEKDRQIAELRAAQVEPEFWKQRYTASDLENQYLKRTITTLETKIAEMQKEIEEIKRNGH